MNKSEQKKFTNKLGAALAMQQRVVKELEPMKNNPSVSGNYQRAVGRVEGLMSVWQYLEMNDAIGLNLLQE